MFRPSGPSLELTERLCRPQRIGVFGHRGVGKTTLLTMLYREAVSGRWPQLRLAAADARTATYLADKISQLEAGQPLPGTLAETDLRFHLYHAGGRIELLFKDYQGEHVDLGREEPIRAFLRDCDAIWLCVDAATLPAPADCLRRQQEVEQIMEDYLATDPLPGMHRPVALVVTKLDLLQGAGNEAWANALGMVRHALRSHSPASGEFGVSSLGGAAGGAPRPINLEAPLAWLASALRDQDLARLDRLEQAAPAEIRLRQRALACVRRRYPTAESLPGHEQRLARTRSLRTRTRALASVSAAGLLFASVLAYDGSGYRLAAHFEAAHAEDPAASLGVWQTYQTWHPTRNLLRPNGRSEEEWHTRKLAEAARGQRLQQSTADWRSAASDPDADVDRVWEQFQALRLEFPEADLSADLSHLRDGVKDRREAQIARRATRAHDELVSAESRSVDLPTLVARADAFLGEFPGSLPESDVRRLRDAALARVDDRDLEAARAYSARQPFNFQTRRELYQNYLDRHPDGRLRSEADAALRTIAVEWDRHDFRLVRDRFQARPGEVAEWRPYCLTYLAIHPGGRYASAARDLLRWAEKVNTPSEYRVVLRGGDFDHKVAFWLSRGPDLSAEIEVAGVRYGPSPVIANRYDPEWNYEFPRPIRWKLGDPIRIRVHDHDYWKRQVLEVASEGPLALNLLSGEVHSGGSTLTFESDFSVPTLPPVDGADRTP
jgi:hypothetical protein